MLFFRKHHFLLQRIQDQAEGVGQNMLKKVLHLQDKRVGLTLGLRERASTRPGHNDNETGHYPLCNQRRPFQKAVSG